MVLGRTHRDGEVRTHDPQMANRDTFSWNCSKFWFIPTHILNRLCATPAGAMGNIQASYTAACDLGRRGNTANSYSAQTLAPGHRLPFLPGQLRGPSLCAHQTWELPKATSCWPPRVLPSYPGWTLSFLKTRHSHAFLSFSSYTGTPSPGHKAQPRARSG